MDIVLPALAYAYDALQPFITPLTLEFHYSVHHRAYIEKTKSLARDAGLEGLSLEDVIRRTAAQGGALFNNAAQAWNHAFYWRSLRPDGGGSPNGAIADRINAAFGNYDNAAAELKKAIGDVFGSGWVWLVLDGEKLRVTRTSNADTPIALGQRPLLAIDVWEHAYYLDYRNRRLDYGDALLRHLISWDFANGNLAETA